MIEDDLRASFAARADERPETADLADLVIGRATAVRRRRTVVTAAASTVAAAVIGFLAIAPGSPAATDEAPVAAPRPAPVAYGAHHVLLSDGTERRLSDEPMRDVRRVEAGWLVTTERSASFVPDTGPPVRLGPDGGYPNLTVDRAGTRVALQTWDAEVSQVHTFALPSVKPLGSGRADGWVASRWVGDSLLVSAANGDAGPVGIGFWSPSAGEPALGGERLLLGAVGGDLLAAAPDGEGTCLVRLGPDLGETGRACDTGFRFGDPVPSVSPDGRHLVIEADGRLASVDLGQAFAGRTVRDPLTVAPGSTLITWDSTATALVNTPDDHVVRCAVGSAACAPVTIPEVAGAPALGVVPPHPDVPARPFPGAG